MTEYDFSPEAYERHLATQARIARWVDDTNAQSPEDAFSPLPEEDYEVVDSPNRYPQEQSAFTPHHPNPIPKSPPLSSSYSYQSLGSPKRHKSKHSSTSSRHTTHRSTSHQPSPEHLGQGFVLPIADGVYTTTAKQAQLSQPRTWTPMTVRSPVRSSSTTITGISYHDPQTSHAAATGAPLHTQQYVLQPSHYPHPRTVPGTIMPMGTHHTRPQTSPAYLHDQYHHQHRRRHTSPAPNSSLSQPHSSSYRHPFFRDPYNNNKNRDINPSPTWTYNSLKSSSVQSLLVTPTPSVPGVTFVQPNPHQIMVPIRGGTGGYVVVPAPGQKVQVYPSHPGPQYIRVNPDEDFYTSDEESPKASFFGSLRLGKKKSLKQANVGRQDAKKRGLNT